MDDISALIGNRLNTEIIDSSLLESYTNESVLAFKVRLDFVLRLDITRRMKLSDHYSGIICRLLTTTRLNREISYAELYKSISRRLRGKFDSAIKILVDEKLVIENTKRGKCYYKLNVLIR